jgi:uncharacterized protein
MPTPQTNVELIEELYSAFSQRDLPAIFSALAPDVEVSQSPALPWGGVYRGVEGFREFFSKLTSQITPALAIERYIDAGEDVVAIGRTQGTVNNGGRSFDVPVVHVWRLREGKVVRFQPYIDVPTMQAALE